MKTLRHMAVIARISLIEGGHKQVFHVLMLFALTLITASTALAYYDHNIQIKIIKDLSAVVIMLSLGLIAITLSVSGIAQEIETRTAYPVLAKPIGRWEYVLGKFAGTMGTVGIGMVILVLATGTIVSVFGHHVDIGVLMVAPFLFIEAAILASIGMFISSVASPALSWFVTVFIYFLGSAKIGLHGFLTDHGHSLVSGIIGGTIYHVLPNLECFNFKDAIVHHLSVPPAYLIQTTIYGFLYVGAMLTLTTLSFNRKEL